MGSLSAVKVVNWLQMDHSLVQVTRNFHHQDIVLLMLYLCFTSVRSCAENHLFVKIQEFLWHCLLGPCKGWRSLINLRRWYSFFPNSSRYLIHISQSLFFFFFFFHMHTRAVCIVYRTWLNGEMPPCYRLKTVQGR